MAVNETAIGVWIPIDPARPMPAPGARPMGQAALAMRAQGITVVFGDRFENDQFVGMVAEPGGWRPVRCEVVAIQDRFPSQSRSQAWTRLHDHARTLGIPVGNGQALTELCRDKLRCQHLLEQDPHIRMPIQEARPEHFEATLKRWGGAFAKPRFGALGTGVRYLPPGVPIPFACPPLWMEPTIPRYCSGPCAPAPAGAVVCFGCSPSAPTPPHPARG